MPHLTTRQLRPARSARPIVTGVLGSLLASAMLVAAPLMAPAAADAPLGRSNDVTVPAAIRSGPAAPKPLVSSPGKSVGHRNTFQRGPVAASAPVPPAPTAGAATLAVDGTLGRAGNISARIVSRGAKGAKGTTAADPATVTVRLAPTKRGGLVVSASPKLATAKTGPGSEVELLLDVKAFGTSGDALSRLVATRAGKPVKLRAIPKGAATASRPGETAAGDATIAVPLSLTAASVTTLAAAPSGEAGDYTATDQSPASTWGTSEQFGAFTWSYPITTPATAGGLDPNLAINYSSTSVDGRLASTNNQASWVGEGFSFEPGHIDRAFASCSKDATSGSNNAAHKTGDLCWKNDNASITFNGSSTRLVKDDTDTTGQTWRLENDDSSKVEHLTGISNGDAGTTGKDGAGEYWRLTTTDGTQYYFGKYRSDGTTPITTYSTWTVPVNGNDPGEPCYNATFTSAFCMQAWRWNLDYVVDVHGNTMTYHWAKELNYYGQNQGTKSVQYVRGGYLYKIYYGQQQGEESVTNDTARVEFGVTERCVARTGVTCQVKTPDELTESTRDAWPDVPFDMICATGDTCTAEQGSPTFFTRKKLTTIVTKVLRGGALTNVSQITLGQSFPATTDFTSPTLFLDSVTATGLVGGSTSLPSIQFGKQQRPNRVDSDSDGSLPLYKYRVSSVSTETGASIAVTYMPAECATKPTDPAANTKRCFPSYWYPNNSQSAVLDWFHTYPVASITEDGGASTSLAKSTSWTYSGGASWHLDNSPVPPDGKHTYSDFRGFGTVTTRMGDSNEATPFLTKSTYLQGMGDTVTTSDGTAVVDKNQFNGHLLEDTTYNGAAVVSRTISLPWTSAETARDDFGPAFITNTSTTRTITATVAGNRTTESTTYFNTDGFPAVISDRGDTAITSDDRCTRIYYAPVNDAMNLHGLPRNEVTVSVACSVTADKLTDTISDTRTFYDNHPNVTDMPTTGDVTRTEALTEDAAGTGTRYLQASRTVYDTLGRPLETYDPLNRKSTTVYTPTDHLPTTAVKSTNALGQSVTTVMDPALGQPTKVTDANGSDTFINYDPLGRRTKVWTGSRATTAVPNLEYAYTVSKSAPSVVTTKTLLANGTSQVASTALFDGLLRPLQTQTPVQYDSISTVVGSALRDVVYDSRGVVTQERGPWPDPDTAPNGIYVSKQTQAVERAVLTDYDGAGRTVASSLYSSGVLKSKTRTVYNGNSIDTLPPAGAPASRVILDARGRTTSLQQFKASTITGTPVTTSYTLNNQDQMVGMTDADGSTWTWTYDLLGRKTKSVDPDSGTSSSTYDDAGQVKTTTDGRGTVLSYTYDDLGRKTSLKQGTTTLATWTYDGTNVTGGVPNSIGRLTESSRMVGTAEYSSTVDGYTEDGQPTQTTTTIPAAQTGLAGTYVRSNYWNTNGSLQGTIMPNAPGFATESQAYNYDLTGRPSRLSAGASIVSAVTRDEYGAIGHYQQSAVSGIGVIVDQLYEAGTHRLQTLSMWRPPSATITKPELYTTFTYNAAGQITMAKDEPDAAAATRTDRQCYQYDPLGRLKEAWTQSGASCTLPTTYAAAGPAPYWTSWEVADDGRRLSETKHATSSANDTSIDYTYPASTVHPTSTVRTPAHAPSTVIRTVGTGAPVSYTTDYTAGGATVRSPLDWADSTMTWDAENHLSTVTRGGTTTSANVYDADGNLLIKGGLDKSRTLMLGDTQITYTPVVGTTPASTKSKRLYSFEGQVVGVRTGTGTAGIYFTPPGPQGTAPLQVNANSNALVKRFYTPYGDDRVAAAGWQSFGGFLAASGATTDALSGLIHLGARDYDPNLGRFLSTDPVLAPADPSQLAAFGYAGNDPINSSDPTGLKATDHDPGERPDTISPTRTNSLAKKNENDRIDRYNKSDRGKQDSVVYAKKRKQEADHQWDFVKTAAKAVAKAGLIVGTNAAAGYICVQTALLGCASAFGAASLASVSGSNLIDGQDTSPKDAAVAVSVGLFGPIFARGASSFMAGQRAIASSTAAKSVDELAEIGFRSDTSHIFRNTAGHLAEDTAENRALIKSALDPANLRDTITLKDGATLQKYFRNLPDGTQAWAEVRNGEITNGGLNVIPR